MIRICLIIHSLGYGGMERVMSQLANAFSQKEDTEVHLVLIGLRREVVYALDQRVTIHRPPFEFRNQQRTLDTLRTMQFLRRRVKEIGPDTALCFGEFWNNLVLLSLYGTGIPVYISDRSRPNKDLGKLHNFLRNRLYPTAAGFVAQTEEARKICLRFNRSKNIKVIGNPIRPIDLKYKPQARQKIVLTVGRLIKTKHIDRLITMFVEVRQPGWKLVIVGGDAQKQGLSKGLKSLVETLDAGEFVSLEGKRNDVDRYYLSSEIFAFSSSSEGFPNVIGEAMAAGLAVVAYDCLAGPADMVDHAESGFLVPLHNEEVFKEQLQKLMRDENLRQRLGACAEKRIQRFRAEVIAQEFFDFILEKSAKVPA